MTAPHEVLGLDADADRAAIEQAYKRRVKEAHPDHGGSAEEFRRVREAYEQLQTASRPGTSEAVDAAGVGPSTNGSTPQPTEPASRTPGGPPQGPASGDETDDQQPKTTVEYVDYEVVADHGWGLDDEDLFEKASEAGLTAPDYGRFVVEPGETLLEAAENRGFAWPFACRGGACANCAVAVTGGDLSMPSNHVLDEGFVDDGFMLSCIGTPTTEELQVVYNVKHLQSLEELRLPPTPFKRAYPGE